MILDPWRSLKSALRQTGALAYHASGDCSRRHRGYATILTYHRVLPAGDPTLRYLEPGMYVQTDVFERHIGFFEKNFVILTFMDLLTLWDENRWDGGTPYLVLTFDDGWRDNFQYAYPILKKHGIPATIFLTVSHVGTEMWFWPEKVAYLFAQLSERRGDRSPGQLPAPGAMSPLGESVVAFLRASADGKPEESVDSLDRLIREMKRHPEREIELEIRRICESLGIPEPAGRVMLNWEEISEMSGGNIDFGSHGCTHRILANLSAAEARREIEDSHRVLSEKGKSLKYIPVFSYPNGDRNEGLESLVREAGYRAAVGTDFGRERAIPSNRFGLRRIAIHNDVSRSIPLLSFRMSGFSLRAG